MGRIDLDTDNEFSETSLKALISAEINDADKSDQSIGITGSRIRAMEYYQGIMRDTPPQENWSRFVSKDVSDVIGWVQPGIIRVFTASDRMVDYEPRRPGDEKYSDQASDYANYQFWVDNDGYRILWDATHDSLLLGDGIVMVYWDDSQECEYAVESGLTEEQVAILQQEEGVEIIAVGDSEPFEDVQEGVDPMTGQPAMMPVMVPTYAVKIKRITSFGRVKMACIEPENFLKSRDDITIDGARFVARRDPYMTRSQLIEMGFDPIIVESLPRFTASFNANSSETNVRDPQQLGFSNGDKSMDRIELYECYMKVDVNGDGVAETVRAYFAGANGSGELLDWQVWDSEIPFVQIPCTPYPHRFYSESLSGEVMDIQQVKTVLIRQVLNNTYQVNNPQRDIESGSIINMDELMNPSVGGVLLRKAGAPPVNYNVVPSILNEGLAAISAMDQVTEMRTGVSRATMALDPSTLQNQTATASNNQRDSAYSQVELIARNQSEGWRKVFSKILKLNVKHQDRPRIVRMRDEYVEIDPRAWNSNMDAYVNVGLGTGSRDRDLAMLNNIMGTQIAFADRFQASGMTNEALDMIPRVVKTATKIVESSGLKNADSYFPDIGPDEIAKLKQQAEQAAQQPPPEVQIEQAKMQAQQQKDAAQMQIDQQKQQAELIQKQQQFDAEMQLKYEQTAQELQLKREQLAAELQLKREQLIAEIALKREQGQQQGVSQDADVSSDVEVGGEPG